MMCRNNDIMHLRIDFHFVVFLSFNYRQPNSNSSSFIFHSECFLYFYSFLCKTNNHHPSKIQFSKRFFFQWNSSQWKSTPRQISYLATWLPPSFLTFGDHFCALFDNTFPCFYVFVLYVSSGFGITQSILFSDIVVPLFLLPPSFPFFPRLFLPLFAL